MRARRIAPSSPASCWTSCAAAARWPGGWGTTACGPPCWARCTCIGAGRWTGWPARPAVRGDSPDWLDAAFARAFGEDRAAEGAALAERAPVDLRVNTIKTDPARALKALTPFDPQPPGLAANALRIPAPAAADRSGAVEAIPQFSKGWFEVQDLGSQVAASPAGEEKGKQG